MNVMSSAIPGMANMTSSSGSGGARAVARTPAEICTPVGRVDPRIRIPCETRRLCTSIRAVPVGPAWTKLFLSAMALVIIATMGCSAPIEGYNYRREPDPRKHEYIVGVSDLLHITVWRNADLSTDARVRPDGTITMPLIGDLKAAGRTPGELRGEIQQKLGAFVKDESAVVTVAVTEVNSYRFTVSGNVEHPGTFNSRYYVSVAEAVAMAGGPNRFATPTRVVIVRQERNGRVRQIPINYEDVRSGERPDQDLVLVAGDTVFVP
jgi:polysaccharide export outer membrane protein